MRKALWELRIEQAKRDGYLRCSPTRPRKAWAAWFDSCEARNGPFITIRDHQGKQDVELRLPTGTTLDRDQRARIVALGLQPQSDLWFSAWDLTPADAERIARELVTVVAA